MDEMMMSGTFREPALTVTEDDLIFAEDFKTTEKVADEFETSGTMLLIDVPEPDNLLELSELTILISTG